ncbi:hypothetical protein HUB98_22455 [Paenibacillus barcinonensis]|uniref:Uncharacterized protein n=2 Tax=Paenibacillus barcinonensis TaxID=198119 RepID=A0ABX6QDJ9_PAEBA|nr:hypothetical protein HUB98_22455 [Paenibacillus barcinonensis]
MNDRELVTSSLFCSNIRAALGTALNRNPKEEYTQWVEHVFELELAFGPVASDLLDHACGDSQMNQNQGWESRI